MSKIGSDHLARQAIVYIRQSTADQVAHNLESTRRQYALVERVRQLGRADVEVIDDDLGRSGSGVARPGFEKLLVGICEGRVGAMVLRDNLGELPANTSGVVAKRERQQGSST